MAVFFAKGAALAAAALIACLWSFFAGCALRTGFLAGEGTRTPALRTACFPAATFFDVVMFGVCFRAIGLSLSTSSGLTNCYTHCVHAYAAAHAIVGLSAMSRPPSALRSWSRFPWSPRASHPS